MKTIDRIYKLVKSVKVAVVLIVLIAVLSVLATLVPQGMVEEFYLQNYPSVISSIILATGFHHFFRSYIFIVLSALFGINLLACTLDRIIKRLQSKAKKRFGPDIIHIGLMILIIGGGVTLYTRDQRGDYLSVGESFYHEPGGFYLTVTDFQTLTYEDGRPKDWITTADIYKDGKLVKTGEIEVNKPMSLGEVKIYQNSYSREDHLIMEDEEDNVAHLVSGKDYLDAGESIIVYLGNKDTGDSMVALLERWQVNPQKLIRSYVLSEGDPLVNFTVKEVYTVDKTGLSFVIDRGFLPVLIGFIIIMGGMALTFIQKAGDEKL